jgi:penicillin G amidase
LSEALGEVTRRIGRYLLGAAIILVGGLAGAAAWLYIEMRASLPQLDGEIAMPGADAAIKVERDALGIPTITAGSRADVARGLGFLQAQDRFFQMDLARRRAAGELSELFGSSAVPLDARTRTLRLRARAQRAIELATPEDRTLLRAYVDGVNAGLNALAAKPPEYVLLRAEPRPWALEDSALVVASMYLTLQDSEARRESRLAAAYEALPKPVADFVTGSWSEWETPLVGGLLRGPAIPNASALDLREAAPSQAPDSIEHPPARSSTESPATRSTDNQPSRSSSDDPLLARLSPPEDDARGSNGWAVAGRMTKDGGAIIANDMHLGLAMPNTWYRASMVWRDARERRLTGVTLPGTPSLVAGSNGDVAWGFTNSGGDWSDLIVLDPDPNDASRYRTPSGMQSIETVHETIKVKGGSSVPVDVRETIWGPIVDRDPHGHDRALAWVPLRDGGISGSLTGMENARTLEQLFDAASRLGVPAQNIVAAQRDGRIGWSIAGRIPRRIGYDGRLPTSWADGKHRWDGWIVPAAYPRVINPSDGRIVTANNRLVEGTALQMLGNDGGYDPGARARQIEDDLKGIGKASVRDMLAVQLDDRAVFQSPWRYLLLQMLNSPETEHSEMRRELRRVVSEQSTGRASIDSAAYRLVREFRAHVAELAFAPFVERIRKVDPEYPAVIGRGGEGPLWALVTKQPMHLLNPKFKSWAELLLAAADMTAEDAQKQGGIATYTWGRANTVRIRHALSRAVPMLGPLLDMPDEPLPGDSNMPRVQGPAFGASERFAVSPGREQDGYLHMPAGESGHPMSPHYRDANAAWAAGTATPFLPGDTVHTLTLRPAPK